MAHSKNPPSGDTSDLERRIISLEEGMMHNERLASKLNDVICEVQARLDEQARQLGKLKLAVEERKHQDPEERSFEDERPPHY